MTLLLTSSPMVAVADKVERRLGDGSAPSDVVAILLLVFAAIIFPIIFVTIILRLRKLETSELDQSPKPPGRDVGDANRPESPAPRG